VTRPDLVADLSPARAFELATLAAELYPHVEPGAGEVRAAIAVGEAAAILDYAREAVAGGAVLAFERDRLRVELVAEAKRQDDHAECKATGGCVVAIAREAKAAEVEAAELDRFHTAEEAWHAERDAEEADTLDALDGEAPD